MDFSGSLTPDPVASVTAPSPSPATVDATATTDAAARDVARRHPGGSARRPARPAVTELRLSAFASHRAAVYPLGPVTLFAGASGSGKSSALRAFEALARLGAGDDLASAFPDAIGCVPERARPDAQGRRGFRIGCTVDGPAGAVHLDVAVQAEPQLRVVGERLTWHGRTLLTTALRDPGRSTVQAEWHTAGATPVTRAPLPDDVLGTALLPLRVAGKTKGQLEVLAAAEQVVVALRSVFACDPQPRHMRAPVPTGEGRLRRGCGNLAEVLHRTRTDCPRRHARLAAIAGAGCAGPVTGLGVEELPDATVRAVLERAARGAGAAGPGRTEGAEGLSAARLLAATPLGRLGDGELRYLALALVLLTGPGVLAMDQLAEVPDAMKTLTVLVDGFDRGLDRRQLHALLGLAGDICADGHIRLVGAIGEAGAAAARETPGVSVVDLEP
ncbi:ATP-binding protein [Streptomyces sp. NPDC053755]|uniref:ATP-binding protein n=1 Tax=Streptomyces sp. NPDC053755 TaxID=3155815 RepID=UPI0034255DB4